MTLCGPTCSIWTLYGPGSRPQAITGPNRGVFGAAKDEGGSYETNDQCDGVDRNDAAGWGYVGRSKGHERSPESKQGVREVS
jgi:hypothetical protein